MRKKVIKVNKEVEEAIDKIFDRLEKGKSVLETKQDKDDKYYIYISDKQLKNIFGFTDEEIKDLHKKAKKNKNFLTNKI